MNPRYALWSLYEKHTFTAVAHLAAMAGVRISVEDPWLYYDVNLTGTLNLLDAGREYGSPNFVLASTSSAYANTKQVPFIETDAADRPLAPYPASKRSAELLGHTYHHIHGTDFIALRFFTVYGPRGARQLAYKLLDAMRLGQPMPLYTAGRCTEIGRSCPTSCKASSPRRTDGSATKSTSAGVSRCCSPISCADIEAALAGGKRPCKTSR